MLSHVRLCATPWTVAHQAPLSMGFSRQEYWSGLPCPSPGDLSDPGIKSTSLMSTCIGRWFCFFSFLPLVPPGKPLEAPCQGPNSLGILCQPVSGGWRETRQEGEAKYSSQALFPPFSPQTAKQVSGIQLILNTCLLIDLWNITCGLSGAIGHINKECLGQGNQCTQEWNQISPLDTF